MSETPLAAYHAYVPTGDLRVHARVARELLGVDLNDTVLQTIGSAPDRLLSPIAAPTPDSVVGATLRLREVVPTVPARMVALSSVDLAVKVVALDTGDGSVWELDLSQHGPAKRLDETLERFLARLPGAASGDDAQVEAFYNHPLPELLYDIAFHPSARHSVLEGFEVLATSKMPVDPHLVPLCQLDQRSVACCSPHAPHEGAVVRWHLDEVPARAQRVVYDTSIKDFVTGLAEELESRPRAFELFEAKVREYDSEFESKGIIPRDFVKRPVRLACQNVVIATAVFAVETRFAGLGVSGWQTCEAPHVAAHEGVRALAATMLCEAFQSGGTMEVRFDAVPRDLRATLGVVPPALRRFGRVRGLSLGATDRAALVPAESRALFLEVTPMTPSLRRQVERAVQAGVLLPEFICYAILAQGLWRAVELEYLLAFGELGVDVLRGGGASDDRWALQPQYEVARAALLLGFVQRKLANPLRNYQARRNVLEDDDSGVAWEVDNATLSATATGLSSPLPWTDHGVSAPAGQVRLFPRPFVDSRSIRAAEAASTDDCPSVILTTSDAPVPDADLPVLRVPESLSGLDREIARRLDKARGTRK